MATIINRLKRNRDTTGDMNASIRKRVYASPRWQKLRAYKIQTNPVCEICEAEGRVTAATEVHHKRTFVNIIDPAERAQVAFDFDNLQSLCKECHSRIHAPFRPKNKRKSSYPNAE
jgi:5-methylcytosine-specific restriction protein A